MVRKPRLRTSARRDVAVSTGRGFDGNGEEEGGGEGFLDYVLIVHNHKNKFKAKNNLLISEI